MGIPEGQESEQGIEDLFEEIITENFLNLLKKKVTQVQEAQRVTNNLDTKRPTPKHIIIKMTRLKNKERINNSHERKAGSYIQGNTNQTVIYFSTETFQARGSGVKYSR